MNIIIFGANGKTGRELIAQGLKQGHSITAFVRDSAQLNIVDKNLKVVKGEVTDYGQINKAVKANNYDAAFSVLGAKGMFKRDLLLMDAMKNIIKALEENGVDKLIHVSFIGVRKDAGKLGFLYKFIIPHFMKNLLLDHSEKDALLKKSSLNWTLVQPPVLTADAFTGRYMHEVEIHKNKSHKLKLSRANLANFMLKSLNNQTYDRKEVFITE
ncbi:hypothetical protein BBD42_00635 [Paenibacillus sp. BIHB 4019]|uniref:NAD(P)-binding domain-containing protein n=1 Tax=Paenibacillus sp. BIHB 4019 TaxID=1870819 RepID=A0A1B2DBR8_9BACL|nr:NAD(P)H-binding protein [Paenibacillus sp. BIHB 4019]ANY65148.1 hypothetical protein BBD42_00635 [Paenibacillus sp. BIHB 4019]